MGTQQQVSRFDKQIFVIPLTYVTVTVNSLHITADYPTGTPISNFGDSLNIESLRDFSHHLTVKFFTKRPSHFNPPVQQTASRSELCIQNLQTQTTKHTLL